MATICNMFPSYSNLEAWKLGIYSHTYFLSLVKQGLAWHCLYTTSCSFIPIVRGEKERKADPPYSVTGIPSKLSNCGSKCQWDLGGVLATSAAMWGQGKVGEQNGQLQNERAVGLF